MYEVLYNKTTNLAPHNYTTSLQHSSTTPPLQLLDSTPLRKLPLQNRCSTPLDHCRPLTEQGNTYNSSTPLTPFDTSPPPALDPCARPLR
eukprot:gene8873-1224_t